MRRGLLLAVAALALLTPARALADANEPAYDTNGMLIEAPITPTAPSGPAILTNTEALGILERVPQGRRLAEALPGEGVRQVADQRELRREDRRLDGADLLRPRPERSRPGRCRTPTATSSRPGRARRSPGRWRAARTPRRRIRRGSCCGPAAAPSAATSSTRPGCGCRFCVALPARARGLEARAQPPQPRPPDARRPADGRASTSSTTGTSSRASRSSTRRSSGRRGARSGSGSPAGRSRGRVTAPVWLLVALDRLRGRLPHRPQPGALERHRRRLRGCRRGGADRPRPPGSVRELPDRGCVQPGLRARRRERGGPPPHPAERTLRGRDPAGRHVRPGRLRGVHPRLPAVRLERLLGQAPRLALHGARSSTRSRSSGWRCSAGATAARRAPRCSRSPGWRSRSRSTRRTRTRTTRSARRSSSSGSGCCTGRRGGA